MRDLLFIPRSHNRNKRTKFRVKEKNIKQEFFDKTFYKVVKVCFYYILVQIFLNSYEALIWDHVIKHINFKLFLL